MRLIYSHSKFGSYNWISWKSVARTNATKTTRWKMVKYFLKTLKFIAFDWPALEYLGCIIIKIWNFWECVWADDSSRPYTFTINLAWPHHYVTTYSSQSNKTPNDILEKNNQKSVGFGVFFVVVSEVHRCCYRSAATKMCNENSSFQRSEVISRNLIFECVDFSTESPFNYVIKNLWTNVLFHLHLLIVLATDAVYEEQKKKSEKTYKKKF